MRDCGKSLLHGFDKRLQVIALANFVSGHEWRDRLASFDENGLELGFHVWILLGELVSMQESFFDFELINEIPPFALHAGQPIGNLAQLALIGRRRQELVNGVCHGIENASVGIVDENQFHRCHRRRNDLKGELNDYVGGKKLPARFSAQLVLPILIEDPRKLATPIGSV